MDEPQAVPSAPPPPTAAANSGLADNVAGALAYISIFPAIFFLLVEPYKNRPFVRFNAVQCVGFHICAIPLWILCIVIPVLGWFVLLPLLALTMIVTFIYCIVKAYKGEKATLPLIGKYIEEFASK